ncbi:MAG: DUF2304 domain-containing protein [Raoultibacter sp.]
MGGYFRIVLILGALVVFFFVLRKLKKTEMSIANSVFWLLFVASLVIAAVFPQIAFFCSDLLGIESPSNFIFLYVIAFLFIKCFTLTVEVSKLGEKVNVLSQEIALKENRALMEDRAAKAHAVPEPATCANATDEQTN